MPHKVCFRVWLRTKLRSSAQRSAAQSADQLPNPARPEPVEGLLFLLSVAREA